MFNWRLRIHNKPAIFNSDQGSRFTSDSFTGVLKQESIAISMDGRGRAFENIFVERLWRNVKYEDMYLKGYGTIVDLTAGLVKYFALYNGERPHQSLANITPDVVYRSAIGGGAVIVDKYQHAVEKSPVPLRSTGASSTARGYLSTITAPPPIAVRYTTSGVILFNDWCGRSPL